MGFKIISNDSFIDALYMTVITISTVGFGELHPFNDTEKLFTIFLILTSIGVFGYVISVVSEFIANNRFSEELKLKKVEKQIQKLKGHTIVCGYGRNGRQAVAKLKKYKKACVVIENNEDLLQELQLIKTPYIIGDATNDEILKKAGVEKANSLITVLSSDADNLYIVLSARQFQKDLIIISRASDESSSKKLKIAGADRVIIPNKLGGEHMASLVVTPDLVEFIDNLSIEGHSTTNLEEILVEDLPKEYINCSITQLDLRKKTGCTVIGFKKADGCFVINPDANMQLQPKSKLIVLGQPDQILKLRQIF
ncbi:MAG: potassium channel protein [Flavobacteriaceae bacterium]|nr:potassium channel protein [Flavobacteriaceae bacterium]